MPYIQKPIRDMMVTARIHDPDVAGELNFAITKLLVQYWQDACRTTVGGSYQAINDILGALEGAKLEFYRRVAVPYEERKIKENGDVY